MQEFIKSIWWIQAKAQFFGKHYVFYIYKKNLSLFQCNNFTINFRVLWKLTSAYHRLMTIVLHCLAGLLHVGVVEYYIVASLHPRKSCHFLLLFKFFYNSIGMSVAVAPDLKKKLGWSSARYFLTTITAVWKIGQELSRIIDWTKAVSVHSICIFTDHLK